jgi:hypothetical protein
LRVYLKPDTLALADGAAVATWTDQGPGGNHATQPTPANRPVLKTNIQNGLPILRFVTASSQYLTTAAFVDAVPNTVFLVAKVVSTGQGQIMDGSGVSNRHMVTCEAQFKYNAGTQIAWGVGDTNWHILEVVFGTAGSYTVDGVLGSSGNVGTNPPQGLTIGGLFPAATAFGSFDLGDVLFYNADIGLNNRAAMRHSLAVRWGIAVA